MVNPWAHFEAASSLDYRRGWPEALGQAISSCQWPTTKTVLEVGLPGSWAGGEGGVQQGEKEIEMELGKM